MTSLAHATFWFAFGEPRIHPTSKLVGILRRTNEIIEQTSGLPGLFLECPVVIAGHDDFVAMGKRSQEVACHCEFLKRPGPAQVTGVD